MTNRIIGYVRVSTGGQDEALQVDALKRYANEKGKSLVLYIEKVSSRKKRPQLNEALKAMTKGDLFAVYKLDRLARSTKELYSLTEEMKEKEVEFVSISDSFDTTTSTGKAMFGMLAVFAEFERDIISERTRAGLEAAKRRGRTGGRPAIDEKTKRQIRKLFEAGESATDIAKEYGIGRSTIYKILNEEKTAGK
ncbi:recombinase family protein [Siminovitchia sp. 179-K 8D1 HS]|uniref:recombinase family protein n=1 Tax=Siminovitchia sp. 179-K 8D1 HS TaxID=3142385 RepID=UPI0039A03359